MRADQGLRLEGGPSGPDRLIKGPGLPGPWG